LGWCDFSIPHGWSWFEWILYINTILSSIKMVILSLWTNPRKTQRKRDQIPSLGIDPQELGTNPRDLEPQLGTNPREFGTDPMTKDLIPISRESIQCTLWEWIWSYLLWSTHGLPKVKSYFIHIIFVFIETFFLILILLRVFW